MGAARAQSPQMKITDAPTLAGLLLDDDEDGPCAADVLDWNDRGLERAAFDEELLAARYRSGDEYLLASARRLWFHLLGDRLQAGQPLTPELVRRDAARAAQRVLEAAPPEQHP